MEKTVRALYVFRERGQPGKAVEQAFFQKNKGMEGDRHGDGGSRQVALLAGEARDWMREQPRPGLCFRRYKANLETQGLKVFGLGPGDRLEAGGVLLQVSEADKECFPECPLFQEGEDCLLKRSAVFLTVEQSGIISINDTITIIGGENS